MHMADALVSPLIGGTFWIAGSYITVKAAQRIKEDREDARDVLMGVLAAFVFAGQMINFSIPGTGSSGHIGGGLLLAILLGRERAFLSMLIILSVQALVFADGGLLALGCNVFNLGFLPCYVAYPFIYKLLTASASKRSVFTAALLASVAALEMGAFFVVLQTCFSGITLIPFSLFTLLMLPIHFAIALVEGVCTALIVLYIYANEPMLLARPCEAVRPGNSLLRRTAALFVVATLLIGGLLSWHASSLPDGLEWALERVVTEGATPAAQDFSHSLSEIIQERTAFLPDYSLSVEEKDVGRLGTSVSGVVGSVITLLLASELAVFFGRRHSRR